MVSSTTTLVIVIVAIILMILFVFANLAKVVSYSQRALKRRAQAANNGPQTPVTPSEALARAKQAANPRSRIAIPLTLRASLPEQSSTTSIHAAGENPSTIVNIHDAPVPCVSEQEELPIYAAGSEAVGYPERVATLTSESTTGDVPPPSYTLSYLEHGQSGAAQSSPCDPSRTPSLPF